MIILRENIANYWNMEYLPIYSDRNSSLWNIGSMFDGRNGTMLWKRIKKDGSVVLLNVIVRLGVVEYAFEYAPVGV